MKAYRFIWRGIRQKSTTRLFPIASGLCGSAALWLGRMSDSGSHLAPSSGLWLAAPFVFNIGTPILLISLPMVIAREMRNRTECHDASVSARAG